MDRETLERFPVGSLAGFHDVFAGSDTPVIEAVRVTDLDRERGEALIEFEDHDHAMDGAAVWVGLEYLLTLREVREMQVCEEV